MLKAMKVTEKNFTTFRQEVDRDFTMKLWQVLNRYIIVMDNDGHWMQMFEEDFHRNYRFVNGESPNTFKEIELNTH